ncbi:hypothetical protein [Candidatus Leptofilum sp.]|uniref:hypothetical protein n=1 Tax=Candidatus Leptofilum sp. TaxID=3241576 RepID=UPI003B5B7A9C
MSRPFTTVVRFFLLILGITFLTLTVHAAPPNQDLATSRPRFNLEQIPHQPGEEPEAESALAVTAPDALLPWSKVAFQSYRNGNWDVFVGNDDGTGQTAVVSTGKSEIHPHLNRGNTKIVYASNSGGDYEIYSIDVDGSGKTALTDNSTTDGNPSWSPDGNKIVFEAYRNGEADIYVMNADGSNQTRLTTSSDFDGMPTWSPDGSQIAFVSRRTGGYRIYVMNADGSGQTQLSNQAYSLRPQWSPDGSQIAYDADGDGDGWQDLWRMNADGSSQSQIYNPSGQTDAWASSWSPDGSRIVYTQISFINYQGNWYWTEAYPDAWGQNAGTKRLSTSGLDWDAAWQTSDITPPISQINPLAAESPGPIPVSWTGSDTGGSGVARYSVQAKVGNGSWEDWTDTASAYGNYPASGGETVAFRVRARDSAFNYETWPIGAETSTSVETYPPSTTLTITPEYSRYNHELIISWGGTDPGYSGIKHYVVQYKIGQSGSWVNWKTNTGQTTAVFNGGTAGETYYFRVRGTDNANNVESWPADDGDDQVTFYRWASYGYAFDNTHTPITGATSTTTPAADGIVPSNSDGSYISYVLDDSTLYSATWSKSGYGTVPITLFEPEPDGYHNVVLPPADNIISNWGFETGTLSPAWENAGGLSQEIVTNTQTSGSYSVRLGELTTLSNYDLTELMDTTNAPQVAVGANGEAHVIWRESNGQRIFHISLLPNGTWTSPEEVPVDDLKSLGVLELEVGNDGSLHVIFTKGVTTSTMEKEDIYYLYRSPDNIWDSPVRIFRNNEEYENQNLSAKLIVKDSGALHLVWSVDGCDDLFYVHRTNNGIWQTPINVSDSCHLDPFDDFEVLEYQGRVDLLWIDDDVIRHQSRNPNGTWTAKVNVFSGGVHSHIDSVFVDAEGVIHLLTSTISTQPIYYLSSNNGWHYSEPLISNGKDARIVGDISGNLHVVWDELGSADINYMKRDADNVWQPPQTIIDDFISPVELLIDQYNKIHLFWLSASTGSSNIYYSWLNSQGNWEPAANISESSSISLIDEVMFDAYGNFHIYSVKYGSLKRFFITPSYVDQANIGTLSQEVVLTPDLANPILSFMYQLGGVSSYGESVFKVSLNGASDDALLFSTKQSSPNWVHEWIDLSPWANETITLTFELNQSTNQPSAWVYLDEVSLGSTYNDVWVDIESVNAGIGETVPIVISYGNRGGALAEDVEISLLLPGSLVFEGSDIASIDESTPTWQIGGLPAKSETQTIVVYVRVRLAAPTFATLTNTVSITTTSNELESLNNTVSGTVYTGKFIYLPITTK